MKIDPQVLLAMLSMFSLGSLFGLTAGSRGADPNVIVYLLTIAAFACTAASIKFS